MSNSIIADTLQKIVRQITRIEKNVDNLREDVKSNSEKLDNLRDEAARQAGDIEAVGRQSFINKKKQVDLPMKSRGNSMRLS